MSRVFLRLHDVRQLDVARSFRSRSTLTTAGRSISSLSRPASTSRGTGLAFGDREFRGADACGRSTTRQASRGLAVVVGEAAAQITRKAIAAMSLRNTRATVKGAPRRRPARGSRGQRHRERGAQLLLRVGRARSDYEPSSARPRLVRNASSSAISSKGDAHLDTVGDHDGMVRTHRPGR